MRAGVFTRAFRLSLGGSLESVASRICPPSSLPLQLRFFCTLRAPASHNGDGIYFPRKNTTCTCQRLPVTTAMEYISPRLGIPLERFLVTRLPRHSATKYLLLSINTNVYHCSCGAAQTCTHALVMHPQKPSVLRTPGTTPEPYTYILYIYIYSIYIYILYLYIYTLYIYTLHIYIYSISIYI